MIALVVLALALSGAVLWQSQRDARARAIEATGQRAAQLAGAVAERVNILVRSTDFVLQQLRREYGADAARLSAAGDALLASFPEPSQHSLSLVDATGVVTYSSAGRFAQVDVRDNDNFQAHLTGGDRMFISQPLLGRTSKTWTIPFTRPVLHEGRFAGMVVVSVSPQYLSQVLAKLELAPQDTIILIDSTGMILAHNRDLAKVIGKTVSPARPFMAADAPARGLYRAAGFTDGMDRIFAWHRIPDTAWFAVVGLEVGTVLAPLEARFKREWINAGVLSGLLGAVGVAALVLLGRLARGQRDVALSEAKLRQLIDGLGPEMFVGLLRLDGVLIEANRPALVAAGLRLDEVIGKPLEQTYWLAHSATLQQRIRSAIEQAAAGVAQRFDVQMRVNDDALVWIDFSLQPLRNASGKVVYLVPSATVIETRKQAELARDRLEAQLRQAQKMEALGTLAGGIAHDFNNILAAISGNLELARADAGPDSALQPNLTAIAKASDRARDLVRQILTFSRRQPQERRVVSVLEVAREAVRLLRASLPAAIELVATLAPDTPNVHADRTQLQQVLINLGVNAGQAIGTQHGRIEIAVSGVSADGQADGSGLAPGRYARLSVTDTGPGMAAATRARIFDPFFTTKQVGEGTGLGLAVVDGIVKSHGGTISVYSEPGQGSVFHLYFPAASADEAIAREPGAAVPQAGMGQRILYLDDDEALVLIGQASLRRLGYQVQGHTRVADAIAAFEVDPAAFDLLITDFNMPDASGLEVAAAVLRLRPDLPIVLVSGLVTDELLAQARALGVSDVILKPHTLEQLASALHGVLSVPG